MRPWLEALESRTVFFLRSGSTPYWTPWPYRRVMPPACVARGRSWLPARPAQRRYDHHSGRDLNQNHYRRPADEVPTGDLDIKGNVTITGKSSSSTIIDGNSLDRVFQILNGKVSISKLTIQHGLAGVAGLLRTPAAR